MCCQQRFSKCIFFKKLSTQYWANPSELLKYTWSWCHTLKIIWCSVYSTYILIIVFNSGQISPDLVIKSHKIVVQWRVTYCFEATGDSVVHEISLSFFTRKHSHIHLPAQNITNPRKPDGAFRRMSYLKESLWNCHHRLWG